MVNCVFICVLFTCSFFWPMQSCMFSVVMCMMFSSFSHIFVRIFTIIHRCAGLASQINIIYKTEYSASLLQSLVSHFLTFLIIINVKKNDTT